MKRICDTRANCGQRYCIHKEDHECQAADDTGRHNCEWMGLVRCNPVEEPAKVVCNQKDACQFKGCHHAAEHRCKPSLFCRVEPCIHESAVKGAKCEPVPEKTNLTSPLRPPRGPALYRCTKAALCGIAECNAFDDHTHDVSVHGQRECGFLLQRVECRKVGEQEPLQGVYFSGKVVKVLSVLKGMDPAEWDKLWAMVTGKTERLREEALEIMADANGPEESVTPAVYRESVRAIISDIFFDAYIAGAELGRMPHQTKMEHIDRATVRIVALPPVRQTLPIGGTGEVPETMTADDWMVRVTELVRGAMADYGRDGDEALAERTAAYIAKLPPVRQRQ